MIYLLILGAYLLSAITMITALWRRTPPVKAPMPDYGEAQRVWCKHAARVADRKAS